jgi:hypothetical protein
MSIDWKQIMGQFSVAVLFRSLPIDGMNAIEIARMNGIQDMINLPT